MAVEQLNKESGKKIMKRVMLLCVLTWSLSGCASPQYFNVNPARHNQATFNQDESFCRAVSAGSIQRQHMQQYQASTFIHMPMYTPRSAR
jgi:hypothetical protein